MDTIYNESSSCCHESHDRVGKIFQNLAKKSGEPQRGVKNKLKKLKVIKAYSSEEDEKRNKRFFIVYRRIRNSIV